MLEERSLFNENFYLELYPDVAEAKAKGVFSSGFDHFEKFGKFERRNPCALFDQNFYLNKYSDVAQAVEKSIFGSAVDHFINFGQKELRDGSVVFQSSHYLAKNKDVDDVVKKDELTGIEHFVDFGIDEGRASSDKFDVGYYLNSYPDLKAAGLNYEQAVQHFVLRGLQEKRFGCLPDVVTGNLGVIPPVIPPSGETTKPPITPPSGGTILPPVTPPSGSTTLPPVAPPTDGTTLPPVTPPTGETTLPPVTPPTDGTTLPPTTPPTDGDKLNPTVTPPKTLSGLEEEPTAPLDLPENAGGGNSKNNPAPKHLQFSTTQEEYYKNTSVRLKDAWVFDASGASDLDKVEFSLHLVGEKGEGKKDKDGTVGKEDKDDKKDKQNVVGKEDKEDKKDKGVVGKEDKEDKKDKGVVGKEDKDDKQGNDEVDNESSSDDEATSPLQNLTVFNTYSKDDRWGWFNYSLSDLAPGKYQLKGVAYDKDGGKSNTAVTHFTVSNEELPMPLIGVIDTGFGANNPDIDYSRVTLGKDLVDGDDNPLLETGEGNEHGTHILGIIAATGNNGVGIYGMNDEAPLWLGRAIGSGKWAESLIEFVDAAKASGKKALVNLSLDMTQVNPDGSVTTRYEFTPKEREALEYARQNGVLIVAAAGNDGDVMSVLGQASQEFDNIITVGAANGNQRADYSSFGYGLDIVTEGGTIENPIVSTVGDDVGTMAGTSIAAAQVTGAASLVWEANPGLNYRQVIEVLKSNATDLNTVGWDKETGAGFLNVDKAVEAAKGIAPVAYAPDAFLTPTTWGKEGLVTPEERATSAVEWQDTLASEIGNPQNFEEKFRGVYNWATDHGYVGAFPNFHWADYGNGFVYGTILLKSEAAEWRDIPASELGNPQTIEEKFRGVYNWATDHGYVGAFPNFHWADYGNGLVYGTILLKSEVAEWRDIPASELGNPQNIEERFRAVYNWATDHGYVGAFPNFHEADYGNGLVYGTILLKADPESTNSEIVNGYTISGNFYHVFQNYQGTLGNPISEVINYSSGVSYQYFENGSIVSSSNGTFPLYGGIRDKYRSIGGLDGRLGAPTSAEIDLGDKNKIQYFENGHIYWNGTIATITDTPPHPELIRTGHGPGIIEGKKAVGDDVKEGDIQAETAQYIYDAWHRGIIRYDVAKLLTSILATESHGGNWEDKNGDMLGAFQIDYGWIKEKQDISVEDFLNSKDTQLKLAQKLYDEKLWAIDQIERNTEYAQTYLTFKIQPEKTSLAEHFNGKRTLYKVAYAWITLSGRDGNGTNSKAYAKAAEESDSIIRHSGMISVYGAMGVVSGTIESSGDSGDNGIGFNEPPLFSNPTESNPLKGFKDPLKGLGKLGQTPGGTFSHNGKSYYGIDILADIGVPIYAMRSGTVAEIIEHNYDTGGGLENKNNFNMVLIKNDNGYYSRYLHLKHNFNSEAVKPLQIGQQVQAGELIGQVGNSGFSSEPHLHIQVDKNDWVSKAFEVENLFSFS